MVGAIVGYAVFNSRLFIEGPQIIIERPANGSTITDSPLIKIKGRAYNIAYLKLNSKPIFTDEEANFSESLLLQPGYNIIQITAEDKFGRQKTNKLELVYSGERKEINEILPVIETATSSEETATSTLDNIY